MCAWISYIWGIFMCTGIDYCRLSWSDGVLSVCELVSVKDNFI